MDAQTLDNYKGVEGQLFVRYVIQEGKQSRVASLSIDGNHAFKEDELLPYVASTPGQPYSEYNVATDRDNILALYYNEGFPEARFTANCHADNTGTKRRRGQKCRERRCKRHCQSFDRQNARDAVEPGDEMKVVYHIDEGPQTRVKRVFVTGYKHTRVGAIRREVLVKPDAPLREGEVIDSQRRLYNLGIFNRVTIEPQNPTGTDANKDVVVLVEEAKRWTIAYGGGFEVQSAWPARPM